MATIPPGAGSAVNAPPAPPGPLPPAPPVTLLTLPQGFWSEWWPHITAAGGALAAVALGAADHFVGPGTGPMAWGPLVDLSLVWAGLGSLGVVAVAAAGKGPTLV